MPGVDSLDAPGRARFAPASDAWNPHTPTLQLLLGAGGIGVLLVAFQVLQHPIWAGQPSGPVPAPGPDLASANFGWLGVALFVFLVVGAALPFRPYHLAQRVTRQINARLLLVLTVVLAVVGSLIYPSNGSDLFDYAGFERMWVVYGDNPLFALPINHPTDWATPLVWFPDRTPAYGPLWAILTWPLVRLAGDSPTAIVLGYKLLSIAAFAACCWLIWRIVEPARRQQSLLLFAWSPLVLVEILGKVHNDILPALGMLAAIWLCGHPAARRTSLSFIAAGALVKVTSLTAAPPILRHLWQRHGWRAVVPGLALAGLLAAACYAPFWQGPQTLASIWHQTSRQSWSLSSVLSVAAATWLPGGPYDLAIRGALALACVAVGGWLVLRAPVRTTSEIAAVGGWLTLAAVLLLTGAVSGQYLVPAVALAALSNDTILRQVVFWLSLGALATYNIDVLALTFGRAWLSSSSYQVLGTLTLLGPAAAMLVARRIETAGTRLARRTTAAAL